MQVKFHKNAIKFLEKCSAKDSERIRTKIKELVDYYNGINLSTFNDLHVKNLDGLWKGYRRIKSGKIRIIFQLDKTQKELLIYEIDFRGDVYK